MLDQVTQGIIDILRDTTREIRNITDPSVDVTTGPSEAAERVELRVALRSELERQCSIGAGTFVIDDGFAQSGLWQVNADLDSGSLIAALAQAQPQAS